MRALLLLPLFLMLVTPAQNVRVSAEDSPVVVVSYKWSKSRQVVEKLDKGNAAPAQAMIPENKNFERNKRINDPVGARDPNSETLDGRREAIEKNVREARSPARKAVDGFAYVVKVQNPSKKVVEIVFWEYQFKELLSPANVVRRQFICGVNIKPTKEKELQAFSVSGPSDLISVGSLDNKSGKLFEEVVVINRVEYADGSIWQRKDWNFSEIKQTLAIALGTPWGAEMCRAL